MSFYTEFELDLLAALSEHLPPVIDQLQQECLTSAAIAELPPSVQGVYFLYLNKDLVYVGKTDADKGLQSRLTRHFNTLSARRNIDLSRVTFKAVRIAVFTVVELETMLIKHYKSGGNGPAWQHSGFGSNDPGRRRDQQKPSVFDITYPVTADLQIDLTDCFGSVPVSTVAAMVKEQLPFVFRFGMSAAEKSEFLNTHVSLAPAMHQLDDLLQRLIDKLPLGWQATVLPGRVLLYKEEKDYSNALPQFILRRP